MNERVPVPEAARRLGLTEGAVRQRISRGTLEGEKDADGRVYVYIRGLNTEEHGETGTASAEVVSLLKEQNEFLHRQLEEEREANRENRRLLAAALERIPELGPATEAPPEARESPVTASEDPVKGDAPPPEQERRSWWRRFFALM